MLVLDFASAYRYLNVRLALTAMNSKPNPAQLLRRLPTKWAVALVAIVIGYTLIQPFVNKRFGWSLPSVASLTGETDRSASSGGAGDFNEKSGRVRSEANARGDSSNSASNGNVVGGYASAQTIDLGSAQGRSETTKQGFENRREAQQRSDPDPPSDKGSSTAAAGLRYGVLKDLGRDEYMSPGGLRYTRGSAEGHRLKHLERHLEDQPGRPGSHGVFYGDMTQVIRWLDDAFERAQSGAKGTSKKQEDRRTVLEARFDKPIGYVGGQTGKRKGNPDANRIRLVVEGDRVITAFPF